MKEPGNPQFTNSSFSENLYMPMAAASPASLATGTSVGEKLPTFDLSLYVRSVSSE